MICTIQPKTYLQEQKMTVFDDYPEVVEIIADAKKKKAAGFGKWDIFEYARRDYWELVKKYPKLESSRNVNRFTRSLSKLLDL